jgi:L-ascorbate metabolism protein UlaG (beta-lactamase superfamily)
MKVIYLYHSGFSVELEKTVLVFDYYKGTLPTWDKTKQIYFFISHKHHDHFNMDIFKYVETYPSVEFFVGSDIHLSEKYLERCHVSPDSHKHIHNIGKNKSFDWNELKIETLRSTDAGVAFLVEVEGIQIYHGGDLNWWHWDGESKDYNSKMEILYKKEIDFIQGRHFQLAFIPVDPRLKAATFYGINYFCKKVAADFIFPMHMWEEYKIVDKIEEEIVVNQYREKRIGSKEIKCKFEVAKIQYEGQEFELWNI